jgi:ABC-type transport system involved in cytochrome c biogenesis ATPase subunit
LLKESMACITAMQAVFVGAEVCAPLPNLTFMRLTVEQLSFAHPDRALFTGLSFSLAPGLTLLQGGDGRGKTTLLRLLAGALAPQAGAIHRGDAAVYFESPADPAHDDVVARAWLAARRGLFPAWDAAMEAELIGRFNLSEHIDKPMFMLSTGSRRKVGLVAAAASQAALTLLDLPFAALDAHAGRVLASLLTEAAASTQRAWVMADYACPASLADLPLAGRIDLGD